MDEELKFALAIIGTIAAALAAIVILGTWSYHVAAQDRLDCYKANDHRSSADVIFICRDIK